MPKLDTKPVALKDLIEKQFQKLAPQGGDDLERIRTHWVGLLGASIAENAKPLYLRGDKLHVSVSGSAWHCELKLLEAEILRRLNQECGLAVEIKSLRFVATK